jgi:hypothetical protein
MSQVARVGFALPGESSRLLKNSVFDLARGRSSGTIFQTHK